MKSPKMICSYALASLLILFMQYSVLITNLVSNCIKVIRLLSFYFYQRTAIIAEPI